jgi:hypothetical protein
VSEPPIRFLDVASMVATLPPPVPWLAPPILPRAALTVLYAPGGDGKSLLAMALTAAVAHGGSVAGIDCKHGVSIYVDAENGEYEIHRRVHTLGLPPSGVRVAEANGLDLRRHFNDVHALAMETKPDLLVLDSLRSLTPGLDENDTKQTSMVLDPLRRLAHDSGTAVLLIHHSNKAGREYRGASSIRDSVDVLWHLGRHDDDPDPQRRFLSCRKMRVATEPDRIWLRLAIDRGRVLIDQADPPDDTPSTHQPVRRALSDDILAAMNGQPQRLATIAEMVGRGPKDGSVRNALSALVSGGQLERQDHDYCKVQAVQTDALHLAPAGSVAVQSADPLRGVAPLHLAPARNALTADMHDEVEQ